MHSLYVNCKLNIPNGTSGTCGSISAGFKLVANGVCGPLTRTYSSDLKKSQENVTETYQKKIIQISELREYERIVNGHLN